MSKFMAGLLTAGAFFALIFSLFFTIGYGLALGDTTAHKSQKEIKNGN